MHKIIGFIVRISPNQQLPKAACPAPLPLQWKQGQRVARWDPLSNISLSSHKGLLHFSVIFLMFTVLVLASGFPSASKADWDPGDLKSSAKRKIEAALKSMDCRITGNLSVIIVEPSRIYDVYLNPNSMTDACLKLLAAYKYTDITYIPTGSSSIIRLRPLEYLTPKPIKYLPLSWEHIDRPHQERTLWSSTLSSQIDRHFATFNATKDIVYFCPAYNSLNRQQKIKAISELFVWLSYYESGFNPLSADADVAKENHPHDYEDYPGEWSVGLYQMSVVDQANYGLGGGYTFNRKKFPEGTPLSDLPVDDLRQPLLNITLATEVMNKMLRKHGIFRVPRQKAYWSTLAPDGRYDKSTEIRDHILKYNPYCALS